MVVIQRSSKALLAHDFAFVSIDFNSRFDDAVPELLVIALLVIVGSELFESLFQRWSAEENHPVEALRFERAHESLDVGIQVWAPGRQKDDLDIREDQLGSFEMAGIWCHDQ